MKKLILSGIILCTTLMVHTQTIKETVDYINVKLSKYGVYHHVIKIQDDYLYISDSDEYKYFERFKINDVYFDFEIAGNQEVGDYKIVYICRNNLKCQYNKFIIYQEVNLITNEGKNPKVDDFKDESGSIYFFDMDAAKRVLTAFKHLQSIVKPTKKKELFGY